MANPVAMHYFGGKGGAGSTTVATAAALSLAESRKVLLVSLDGPSSLSDLAGKRLTEKPLKLQGKGDNGLFAAEPPHDLLSAQFQAMWRQAVAAAPRKGVLLSDAELLTALEASLGGYCDVGALVWAKAQLEGGQFDVVILDGFAASRSVTFFEHLFQARRAVGVLRGERVSKAGKLTMNGPSAWDGLAEALDQLIELVRDSRRFAFHLVTVGEPVADVQTRYVVNALKARNIPVADIITNQVEAGKASTIAAARRGLQAPHVRRYQTLGPPVALLERRVRGPATIDELEPFARLMASGKETKSLAFSAAEGPPALVRAPGMPPIAAPPLSPTRFLFFVGAGGVGKSSCAAAAAVTLTEKEGPVLLVSADPAHSLSEVLQSRLTDTETQVKGTKGLYAREIDFAGWFAAMRKRWREKVEAAFGPEVKGQEHAPDREFFRNLMDFAPQGFEDLAPLSILTDALIQERFKRIVVDPPPTRNQFSLLELPAALKAWLQPLQALAQKHKARGFGPLGDELAALQKHLERFEKAVVNPSEARFIVLARPEPFGIPQTERLLEYLKGRGVPVERVLVNRILPQTTCPLTEERRANELEVARALEKRVGLTVTVTPALGRHPAALRELKGFRTAWYALSPANKVKAA